MRGFCLKLSKSPASFRPLILLSLRSLLSLPSMLETKEKLTHIDSCSVEEPLIHLTFE
jgi:hypothetical protein